MYTPINNKNNIYNNSPIGYNGYNEDIFKTPKYKRTTPINDHMYPLEPFNPNNYNQINNNENNNEDDYGYNDNSDILTTESLKNDYENDRIGPNSSNQYFNNNNSSSINSNGFIDNEQIKSVYKSLNGSEKEALKNHIKKLIEDIQEIKEIHDEDINKQNKLQSELNEMVAKNKELSQFSLIQDNLIKNLKVQNDSLIKKNQLQEIQITNILETLNNNQKFSSDLLIKNAELQKTIVELESKITELQDIRIPISTSSTTPHNKYK